MNDRNGLMDYGPIPPEALYPPAPQSTGRLCDLPAQCPWRPIAFWLMIAGFLGFLAWIAVPAARAVVEAASAGPAACASVAASDRTACVSGGW